MLKVECSGELLPPPALLLGPLPALRELHVWCGSSPVGGAGAAEDLLPPGEVQPGEPALAALLPALTLLSFEDSQSSALVGDLAGGWSAGRRSCQLAPCSRLSLL